VEVHPRLGHALDALLLEQYTAGIDLVVMCSHGRGGVSRVALGSIATGLLQRGTAPVLLARAFGEPVALEQAVVPLDGSARAEEALRLVERLAGSVIHEVTLLRVIDRSTQGPEAERYLEQIAHSLQARGVHCTPHASVQSRPSLLGLCWARAPSRYAGCRSLSPPVVLELI
jgi:nucleotide-binding universal stress UspA family protein